MVHFSSDQVLDGMSAGSGNVFPLKGSVYDEILYGFERFAFEGDLVLQHSISGPQERKYAFTYYAADVPVFKMRKSTPNNLDCKSAEYSRMIEAQEYPQNFPRILAAFHEPENA